MTKLDKYTPKFIYKGRRPKLEADERTFTAIRELSRLHATQAQAAAVLNCSVPTLKQFFRDFPVARQQWDDGREEMKARLKAKIVEKAIDDGDTTMLKWLASQTQWLSYDSGQDRQRQHETDRDEKLLSEAERLARLKSLQQRAIDGGKLLTVDTTPAAKEKPDQETGPEV